MKKFLILSFMLALAFVLASSASAQIVNPVIKDLGNDPAAAASGATFLGYFIVIWRALISIGGLTVIIYFLWGGLEWIYAGGDAGKIGKARDKITQAIIGMILLVGSFVIIGYISKIFFGDNFDLLRLSIPGTQASVPHQVLISSSQTPYFIN